MRLIMGQLTISTSHPPLHDDDLLTLPRVQDGHASDRGSRLQGNRIHGIIRTDDERNVRIREVVVDLVHLEDDIIWDASLGQQYVTLSRHAARDGMNRESHVDSFGFQHLGDVTNGVLSFSDRHAIAYYYDYTLGGRERICCLFDGGFGD